MIISLLAYRSSLFAETRYWHEHNSQSQSVKQWLSLAPPAQKQQLISAQSCTKRRTKINKNLSKINALHSSNYAEIKFPFSYNKSQ